MRKGQVLTHALCQPAPGQHREASPVPPAGPVCSQFMTKETEARKGCRAPPGVPQIPEAPRPLEGGPILPWSPS